MRERVRTSYSGLLQRFADAGYFAAEEEERIRLLLETGTREGIAFAAHEFARRLLRRGRLTLWEGDSERLGNGLTLADQPRELLFVLPALPQTEAGVFCPPLDPNAGPAPEFTAAEIWKLFECVSGGQLASAERVADLKAVVTNLLDLLRELLQVPAALFFSSTLPIPEGIARGPRSVLFGDSRTSREPTAALPGHPPGTLPPAWARWVRRARDLQGQGLYLPDFGQLPHDHRPGPQGSAILVPLAAQDPSWDSVLALAAIEPNWFHEGRLARLRVLATHIRRLLSYAVRLQDLVSVDFLTGIYNRGFFEDQLERLLAGMQRREQTFALLIVDIDDFKAFNTRFGYDAGDEVLRVIARKLRGTLRSTDVIARYGGEEFAIILAPPVTPEEAEQISERLRTGVAELRLEVPTLTGQRRTVQVTVSIGVALYPTDGRERVALWNQANRMQLEAKLSGKNRVRFRPAPPSD